MEEYLTVLDLVRLLKLSRQKIAELISCGDIKASRVGHQYRISKTDFAAYMKGCLVNPVLDKEE